MTRIWLRENKLQGLFRRERMRVYKTVTISKAGPKFTKLLFKKKNKTKTHKKILVEQHFLILIILASPL